MGPLPLKGPAETDQNIIDLILKEDYTEAFFNCLQKIAKNESTEEMKTSHQTLLRKYCINVMYPATSST